MQVIVQGFNSKSRGIWKVKLMKEAEHGKFHVETLDECVVKYNHLWLDPMNALWECDLDELDNLRLGMLINKQDLSWLTQEELCWEKRYERTLTFLE